MTLDRTLATLHGVVRNATTGEGLPRALVRVEGDANTGALTDGEGRFEISNISVGPQSVSVQKPGFLDCSPTPRARRQGAEQFVVAVPSGGHNILVAARCRMLCSRLSRRARSADRSSSRRAIRGRESR